MLRGDCQFRQSPRRSENSQATYRSSFAPPLQLKFLRGSQKYLRKNCSATCSPSIGSALHGADWLPNKTSEGEDGMFTEELVP
jgi:hypothetical protein